MHGALLAPCIHSQARFISTPTPCQQPTRCTAGTQKPLQSPTELRRLAEMCSAMLCSLLYPLACNCGVTALFPWIRPFLALPQSRNTHLLSACAPSWTCCPSDTPTLLLVHMSWGIGHVQPKYPLQRRLSGGTIETQQSIYTNACRFPCSNYFTVQRMIQ